MRGDIVMDVGGSQSPLLLAPANSPSRTRRGRVPTWIPLLIAAALVVWIFDGMTRGVEAAGFEIVDPRSARLRAETGFCDPRWDDALRRSLATLPKSSIHDRAAIERIKAAVAALPFVSGVGEAQVLWPDSIDMPLCLRTPAACVLQGTEYLPVSADGVFLPGRWPTPPWIATAPGEVGFLPVIGPNDGAFERVRPGDRLREPRHLDALAVALAMRAELSEADFQVIGPPLIDATEARLDPVASKGVLVLLEARRTIRFGRAPNAAAVGERPAEKKWEDIRRAIGLLRGLRATPPTSDARDWAFLDVRWDTPDIAWRDAEPAPPVEPQKKRP
jgi:hypothetical protein